jgi:hypothetical protein
MGVLASSSPPIRWLDNAPGKKALGKNAIGEGRGLFGILLVIRAKGFEHIY